MLCTCSFVILDRIIFHSTRSLSLSRKTDISNRFKMRIHHTKQFLHFLFKQVLSGKIIENFAANKYAQPSAGVKACLHFTRDNDLLSISGIFGFYMKKKLKIDSISLSDVLKHDRQCFLFESVQ